MSVQSGQSVTVLFTTRNPSTGAANADSLPTGTLYVNGTANGATVTVTNIATGIYKAAVTLPTLAIGDIVGILISATVGDEPDNDVVWSDTKDLITDSGGAVESNAVEINSVSTNGVTTINANLGTEQPVNQSGTGSSAVVKSDGGSIFADPLQNDVPGSYSQGTAGYALGRIGSASVIVTSPLAADNTLTLYQGDDYFATDGMAIDWPNSGTAWADLTGAAIAFTVFDKTGAALFSIAGSVITPTSPNQKVRAEPTNASTKLLTKGTRTRYTVVATLSNGHQRTLIDATCICPS